MTTRLSISALDPSGAPDGATPVVQGGRFVVGTPTGGGAGLFRGAWSPVASRLVSVPMTGPSSPAPYSASASSNYSTDYPWKLFDQNGSTKWQLSEGVGAWAKIDLGTEKRLDHYTLSTNSTFSAWRIQGSNDGSTWTTVDTRSTPANGTHTLATPATYRHFRIVLDNSLTTWKMVYEWALWQNSDQPYMDGEYVTHAGRLWQSDSDNNAGTPTVSGWTEIPVGYYSPGPTGSRPANPTKGPSFFDETLGKPIWWNGTGWVDATGAAV